MTSELQYSLLPVGQVFEGSKVLQELRFHLPEEQPRGAVPSDEQDGEMPSMSKPNVVKLLSVTMPESVFSV